jgi:hypothetical protein
VGAGAVAELCVAFPAPQPLRVARSVAKIAYRLHGTVTEPGGPVLRLREATLNPSYWTNGRLTIIEGWGLPLIVEAYRAY